MRMTNERPDVAPDGRYSINEVTALLGISRSTLRRYTDKGVVKCGRRRTNGRPFYTGRAVLQLWMATL